MVRIWKMQLCSYRYVRITGLLNTPLVNLKIWDWLCVLPAITLVVLTSPRKLTKLPPQTGEQLNPQDGRHSRSTVAFPLGGVRGHFI